MTTQRIAIVLPATDRAAWPLLRFMPAPVREYLLHAEAKATPDAILDAIADAIKAAVTQEVVCSGEPANFAGIAAVALADVAFATGDMTKANGDTSGRKCTQTAKSAVTIDSSGTATHVILASASVLLYVTTCTSQVLTAGGTVTIPTWKFEVADPA